jgi:hypothetical protein
MSTTRLRLRFMVDEAFLPLHLSYQVEFVVRLSEFFLQLKNSFLKFHVLAADFQHLFV